MLDLFSFYFTIIFLKYVQLQLRHCHREGRITQVAVRHVEDIREGGSTFKHVEGDHPQHAPYVVDIRNAMTDLLGKHGFVFRNDATRSLGFVTALRRHDMTARFGTAGTRDRSSAAT